MVITMSKFFNSDNRIELILHYTSVIGMHFLLYGVFYLTLDLTVGRIDFVQKLLFFGIPVKFIIFTIIIFFIIIKFFKISSPYKK